MYVLVDNQFPALTGVHLDAVTQRDIELVRDEWRVLWAVLDSTGTRLQPYAALVTCSSLQTCMVPVGLLV